MCVQHEVVNEVETIAQTLNQSIERIDLKQSRSLAKKIKMDVLRIWDGGFASDAFNDFLVFQKTANNDHGLNYYASPETKERHREHYSVYDSVTKETFMAITSLGCYISDSLHETPHCSEEVRNIEQCRNRANSSDVELVEFPHLLEKGVTDEFVVCREYSDEMLRPEVINFPKAALVEFVINNVRPTVAARNEGPTWSVDMGYGRPQPRSDRSKDFTPNDGREPFPLPFFKAAGRIFLWNMPCFLGMALGALIVHLQNVLLSHYPNEMNDDIRSNVFQSEWTSHGFCCHEILFEYINIIVKPERGSGPLQLHMDYENGQHDGYKKCVVFWYLHRHEGELYRVTMVMAFRKRCDESIRKIRNEM